MTTTTEVSTDATHQPGSIYGAPPCTILDDDRAVGPSYGGYLLFQDYFEIPPAVRVVPQVDPVVGLRTSNLVFLPRVGIPRPDVDRVTIDLPTWELAQQAWEASDRVLMPVLDEGTATHLILFSDSDAQFVGPCGDSYTEQSRADHDFARQAGYEGDHASYLMGYIFGTGEERVLRSAAIDSREQKKSWAAADPRSRVVNPAVTPASTMERLDRVGFFIELPDGWTQIPDLTICTWMSEGWNGCIPVTQSPIDLGAFVLKGEDAELWLLDGDGNTTEPVAMLGTVPGALIDQLLLDTSLHGRAVVTDTSQARSRADIALAIDTGSVSVDWSAVSFLDYTE